jgi:hypothetical protein
MARTCTQRSSLFHVSEEPGIEQFEPRSPQDGRGAVVWAIDADHLRNYLLPRDCPRVTYYAGRSTTHEDAERFLGSSMAVVAIEEAWLERVQRCRLYCYHLPSETFECVDHGAGYFVSLERVVPARVDVLNNPIAELRRRGVDVRILSNLWALRDAVVESTLQFSMIRMRNALPREAHRGAERP